MYRHRVLWVPHSFRDAGDIEGIAAMISGFVHVFESPSADDLVMDNENATPLLSLDLILKQEHKHVLIAKKARSDH
jgi:hypothetical protein